MLKTAAISVPNVPSVTSAVGAVIRSPWVACKWCPWRCGLEAKYICPKSRWQWAQCFILHYPLWKGCLRSPLRSRLDPIFLYSRKVWGRSIGLHKTKNADWMIRGFSQWAQSISRVRIRICWDLQDVETETKFYLKKISRVQLGMFSEPRYNGKLYLNRITQTSKQQQCQQQNHCQV